MTIAVMYVVANMIWAHSVKTSLGLGRIRHFRFLILSTKADFNASIYP